MKTHLLYLLTACMSLTSALPSASPSHDHMSAALVHDPKIKQTPSFSMGELYNLTTGFFDAFMYPNNLVQSESINSTLFATDVLGRVDATRTFPGQEVG
jgi:hypothetical protein